MSYSGNNDEEESNKKMLTNLLLGHYIVVHLHFLYKNLILLVASTLYCIEPYKSR